MPVCKEGRVQKKLFSHFTLNFFGVKEGLGVMRAGKRLEVGGVGRLKILLS